MYVVAMAAAAFSVVGMSRIVDPEATLLSDTAVDAAFAVSVTVPTAFERPAASCCIARTIFFRSLSVMPGT
jgi:hypothetical protein